MINQTKINLVQFIAISTYHFALGILITYASGIGGNHIWIIGIFGFIINLIFIYYGLNLEENIFESGVKVPKSVLKRFEEEAKSDFISIIDENEKLKLQNKKLKKELKILKEKNKLVK